MRLLSSGRTSAATEIKEPNRRQGAFIRPSVVGSQIFNQPLADIITRRTAEELVKEAGALPTAGALRLYSRKPEKQEEVKKVGDAFRKLLGLKAGDPLHAQPYIMKSPDNKRTVASSPIVLQTILRI
jgi:hypothetical protein